MTSKYANKCMPSRLVDWLRVPTPMRAIRVRAWVEVVGSVMEFISFQSSMKCEKKNFFSRHLAWKAESSLSEDELSCKVLGPAVYTKMYCRVQRNRVLFIPVQWENRVTLTMKRNRGGSAVPYDKAVALAACRQPGGCRRIPYIGSERKNSVRKTGECYKHREEKSGSVALRPVEIPPLYRIWRIPTAYSCSNTSSWPMSRLLQCCAWMS